MQETIRVEQRAGRFVALTSFEQRAIPKAAGFRWDPERKQWWTSDPAIAARLADSESIAAILAVAREREAAKAEAVAASRAADSDVDIPAPDGYSYMPFQRAGIAAALARESVLFGDEMGLGKTIQAIGVINSDPSLRRILVVCPASLKLNWKREFDRWLVRPTTIGIAGSSSFPDSSIVIINYDILTKHQATIMAAQWDALIVDEAHYLKNPDAQRTRAVVGVDRKKGADAIPGISARRKMFLTGTPIPNRPIEGWPLFHYLAPQEFRSFFGYAKQFCGAHQGKYGWDFTGATNLAQLQEKLRSSILIRRLKADVLTELPAKRRAVIELPANGASGAIAAEAEAWDRQERTMLDLRTAVELAKASDRPEDYAEAVARLSEAARAAFTEMSRLRHDTAVAKIPYVIAHLTDSIEGGRKVIVFAHHHDVIEALAEEFGGRAVVVYGDTPLPQRQANVDRFQSDPACQVFIGGIQAAGVGLTLTASSHVLFAELDWVPGNMTQAEDRAHRIGQREMVLIQHLVLEGSLDARMAQVLVQKQEIADRALDRAPDPQRLLPTAEIERAATESLTRTLIDKAAAAMTTERAMAIHTGLRMLAGMCDGARCLDGAGFSKIDVVIGHSLANAASLTARQATLGAKLVNKYRRQLPQEVVVAAKAD